MKQTSMIGASELTLANAISLNRLSLKARVLTKDALDNIVEVDELQDILSSTYVSIPQLNTRLDKLWSDILALVSGSGSGGTVVTGLDVNEVMDYFGRISVLKPHNDDGKTVHLKIEFYRDEALSKPISILNTFSTSNANARNVVYAYIGGNSEETAWLPMTNYRIQDGLGPEFDNYPVMIDLTKWLEYKGTTAKDVLSIDKKMFLKYSWFWIDEQGNEHKSDEFALVFPSIVEVGANAGGGRSGSSGNASLLSTKLDQTALFSQFDPMKHYDVGDLATYNGKLLSANEEVDFEDFNESQWSETSVSAVLDNYATKEEIATEQPEYTAFEVYPTLEDIPAGTKSDQLIVGSIFSSAQNYVVDDIVLVVAEDKAYTCIQNCQGIVPGQTEGWEQFWHEGSLNGNNTYLKYEEAVPAKNVLRLMFYSYEKTKDLNDVIVDWGDGSTTKVNEASVIYQNYQDNDQYKYSGFTLSHTYQTQQKFIVKIYGKDYFMMRDADYGIDNESEQTSNSIISRVFDRDLPVASCLRNISSFCRGSLRLLKISIPYEYDFKNLCNISNMFRACLNLQAVFVENGTIALKKFQSYSGIFYKCKNLRCHINYLIKFLAQQSEQLQYGDQFYGCESSHIYGKIDGTSLWLSPMAKDIPPENRYKTFKGCPNDIRSQVPVSWGGTNIEIENDIFQKQIDFINDTKDEVDKMSESIGEPKLQLIDYDELKLNAYVRYYDGYISDTDSNYAYAVFDDVKPGETFYISTKFAGSIGAVAFDHGYMVKSWNTDEGVRLQDGTVANDINAAAETTGIDLQELSTLLQTASKDDPIHYRRIEHPESTYLQKDPSINAYQIVVPKNATELYVSNTKQTEGNELSASHIATSYGALPDRVSSIERKLFNEEFVPVEFDVINDFYLNEAGTAIAYSSTACGITPLLEFKQDDVFRYTASIRQHNSTYAIFDIFGRKLSAFNGPKTEDFSKYVYENEIVQCSSLVEAFPLARYIRFGCLENNKQDPLSLKVEKLQLECSNIIKDARYDNENKTIVIEFDNKIDPLSINLSDLIDEYEADGMTLTANGNVFSVKDGVFATVQQLSQYAASTYVDESVQALNVELNEDIDNAKVEVYNNALSDANNYADGISTALSTDYVEKLQVASNLILEDIGAVSAELSSMTIAKDLVFPAALNEYELSGKMLYRTSGNTTAASTWAVTELIEVKPYDYVEVSGYCRGSAGLIAFYDSTSAFVSPYPLDTVTSRELCSTALLVPENASFMRVGTGNDNSGTFQPIRVKIYKLQYEGIRNIIDKNLAKLEYKVNLLSTEATVPGDISTYVNLSDYVIYGNYITGGHLNPIYNDQTYGYTDYIPITSADTVLYSGKMQKNKCVYEVYDIDKNMLTCSTPLTANTIYTDLTIQLSDVFQLYENGTIIAKPAYCRFSTIADNITQLQSFRVLKNNGAVPIKTILNDLHSKQQLLETYSTKPGNSGTFIELNDYVIPNKFLNGGNGKESGNSPAYSCTKYLPIENGDVFKYSGVVRYATANPCGYAIYDSNHGFLSAYLKDFTSGQLSTYEDYEVDATTLISEYEEANPGKYVKFIRFSSCRNNAGPTVKVLKNNMPIPVVAIVDEISAMIDGKADIRNALFGKTYLTLGDSYSAPNFSTWTDDDGNTGTASLQAYDSTTGMYKNYGWHIAYRNHMNYINAAKSGGTLTYFISSDVDHTPQTANSFSNDLTKGNEYSQQLSNYIAQADYITIAYGLNDQKWYDGHWLQCPVGERTDSDISTMWGAWNTVLSTILTLNPTVKIGIILTDGGFTEDQRSRQLSVANWWGIPTLDLMADPKVPMMTYPSASEIPGRGEVNQWARQQRLNAFCMSESDNHPNPIGHEYRSTVIENFLRSL